MAYSFIHFSSLGEEKRSGAAGGQGAFERKLNQTDSRAFNVTICSALSNFGTCMWCHSSFESVKLSLYFTKRTPSNMKDVKVTGISIKCVVYIKYEEWMAVYVFLMFFSL